MSATRRPGATTSVASVDQCRALFDDRHVIESHGGVVGPRASPPSATASSSSSRRSAAALTRDGRVEGVTNDVE